MIERLLDFLFPEHCHGCGISGTALCTDCAERIARADPIHDPAGAFALFAYNEPLVRAAIWQLKYHRKSSLAKALVRHGLPDITASITSLKANSTTLSAIVLVPIPQHYTKTFSRGFNQSALIARWIAAAIPTVTVRSLLQKNKAHDSQAHTGSKWQRQHNIADSMSVREKQLPLDPDMLYIVVDDVITSGSTIREASRALRAAGAVHIGAVALAHGSPKNG